MNFKFPPERPINTGINDFLGYFKHVEILEAWINATEAPFTFGVLGDWGTGKTSILNLLRNRLNNQISDTNLVPIWFDAWKYEYEENVIYPLLRSIQVDFEQRASNESVSEKNNCKVTKLIRVKKAPNQNGVA